VARNHVAAKPGTKSVCHYLRDLNYRVGIVGKTHASPKAVFPFDRVGGRDLAGDQVRKYMTAESDKPFCLFCCSNNAHPPWRSGDASKIDSDKVKLPPVIHDSPPTRKTFIGYLAEVVELDRWMKTRNDPGAAMDVPIRPKSKRRPAKRKPRQ